MKKQIQHNAEIFAFKTVLQTQIHDILTKQCKGVSCFNCPAYQLLYDNESCSLHIILKELERII